MMMKCEILLLQCRHSFPHITQQRCTMRLVLVRTDIVDLFHKSFKPLCFPPSQGGLRGL